LKTNAENVCSRKALEDEDKMEALKGILEGEGVQVGFSSLSSSLPPGSLRLTQSAETFPKQEDQLEPIAQSILAEYKRLLTLPPPRSPSPEQTSSKAIPSSLDLTPEQLEAQRRAWLVKQYGLVEDSAANASAGGSERPGPGEDGGPGKGKKGKGPVDPVDKELLEKELARLDMKKKQKKKLQEDGELFSLLSPYLASHPAYARPKNVELLALKRSSKLTSSFLPACRLCHSDLLNMPNLNHAKVKYAQEQQRESLRNAAVNKKNADKAALAKQKADAAADLEKKRKKAAKGERRA
jgi:hypothetical protein